MCLEDGTNVSVCWTRSYTVCRESSERWDVTTFGGLWKRITTVRSISLMVVVSGVE